MGTVRSFLAVLLLVLKTSGSAASASFYSRDSQSIKDFFKVGAFPKPASLERIYPGEAVIPKPLNRISVNQFKTNDIPFKPSARIPLNPTLEQRSGAIQYDPQKLISLKDFVISVPSVDSTVSAQLDPAQSHAVLNSVVTILGNDRKKKPFNSNDLARMYKLYQ